MINRGKFRNIENEAFIGELTEFVGFEVFSVKTATDGFEAVEVGGVILLKSTDQSLHIELSINFTVTEVGKADFNLITEFGSLSFGSGNLRFNTFREFDGWFWTTRATAWWGGKCGKEFG